MHAEMKITQVGMAIPMKRIILQLHGLSRNPSASKVRSVLYIGRNDLGNVEKQIDPCLSINKQCKCSKIDEYESEDDEEEVADLPAVFF